jgi:hypothetical protein
MMSPIGNDDCDYGDERNAATRQRVEQNRIVERRALIGLPQVAHFRPALAFARAAERALINSAVALVRDMVTLLVVRHAPGVNHYRYGIHTKDSTLCSAVSI